MVSGCGALGGREGIPPNSASTCCTLLGGGGGSLFISLSLYLFSQSLFLYSLYPFSSSFLMVYLSLYCPHTLLSLSLAPILTKVWGMAPRGEGTVDKGGKGNYKS